jgi:hypothetical protein
MPNETKLKKLEELLGILDASISRTEFESSFKQVLDFVKSHKENTAKELQMIAESVKIAISRIETTASDNHAKTSEKLTTEAYKLIDDINFAKESFLAEAQAKLDSIEGGEDGLDGLDADEDVIVGKVLAKIPKPVIPEVDLSEVYEEIDELKKKQANVRTAPFIGPSRGIFLHVNGVKKGLVNAIDIVGSGVATSVVNGLLTITITGGSGGSTVGTPTGTVNGSNLIFTVANAPLYVIVDGVSKFETLHYTYGAGTITLLADNAPVQFIKYVY